MEVRNNMAYTPAYKPAFGMAFKKPKAGDMEQFTETIVGKGWAGRAKKGLGKIVKQQANNQHFDIEYHPGSFDVIPSSPEAKKMYSGESFIRKEVKYPNVVGMFRKKYCSEEYKEAYKKSSLPIKIGKSLKKFFAGVRAYGKAILNPVESMPAALRKASDTATLREQMVNKKIAEEVAETTRKAKNKAMIESVFE